MDDNLQPQVPQVPATDGHIPTDNQAAQSTSADDQTTQQAQVSEPGVEETIPTTEESLDEDEESFVADESPSPDSSAPIA